LSALNVSVSERVSQIELNMERWRWLPKSLGEKYLLVNIADFSVSVVDAGKTVLSMPVVVGNSYRKTPVFSAHMTYLEFAPYWYVPKTILEEDKLPLIRNDPTYIERKNFEMVSWDRETVVDPATIDWDAIDAESFPGLLRQKPGPWNALGRVKFMLPNQYAVYLHDTNERHLFGQRNRQFSSGCIRLKRPAELARYLLEDKGWDETDVADALASEKPKRVYLEKALPVHVLYWTAWVDDAGQVNFREDGYGRDRDLAQALGSMTTGCVLHKQELSMQ
jgi:murein L,D-transpeptidase YcbB/YkuD